MSFPEGQNSLNPVELLFYVLFYGRYVAVGFIALLVLAMLISAIRNIRK